MWIKIISILKKKYSKEFVVIYDQKVVFHDKDLNKVIEYARELEAGKQRCETNEANNIQTFHMLMV